MPPNLHGSGSFHSKRDETMKIKLDENMPSSAAPLLRQRGYDVHTVSDEALNGDVDERIAEICRKEQRVLITLDADFSDIRPEIILESFCCVPVVNRNRKL